MKKRSAAAFVAVIMGTGAGAAAQAAPPYLADVVRTQAMTCRVAAKVTCTASVPLTIKFVSGVGGTGRTITFDPSADRGRGGGTTKDTQTEITVPKATETTMFEYSKRDPAIDFDYLGLRFTIVPDDSPPAS